MGVNKLQRFAENATFPHIIQPTFKEVFRTDYPLKGKWGANFFKREKPIVLELGCGRGEYTVALAEKYPEKNFIGMDIKGARIWYGARAALQRQLPYVAFLRTRIDFLRSFFAPSEVQEIWLTFPDPQKEKERKRLTSPRFMELYKQVLAPDGCIHLKTDSLLMHTYTLDEIKRNNFVLHHATTDLYNDPAALSSAFDEARSVQTFYEQLYLQQQKPITYLTFSFQ